MGSRRRGGREVRQRPAKPRTAVRIRSAPLQLWHRIGSPRSCRENAPRAVSAPWLGERLPRSWSTSWRRAGHLIVPRRSTEHAWKSTSRGGFTTGAQPTTTCCPWATGPRSSARRRSGDASSLITWPVLPSISRSTDEPYEQQANPFPLQTGFSRQCCLRTSSTQHDTLPTSAIPNGGRCSGVMRHRPQPASTLCR